MNAIELSKRRKYLLKTNDNKNNIISFIEDLVLKIPKKTDNKGGGWREITELGATLR